MYTIAEVSRIPIEEVLRYVRAHYPPQVHFYANEFQLRYLTLLFLEQEGLLDAHDAQILHEPYFGQIYVAEGGNVAAATEHFIVDFIPGLNYLPYIF